MEKQIIDNYLKEHKEYKLVDYYVDDGYSGTNFDRPSFKRIMKDIELCKINMIITKDMSRLGRDYIGTGELIEKCNLKGYCIGDATVSTKHANFIVNKGNATGKDIVSLINKIKEEVKNKYKIELILEQIILE